MGQCSISYIFCRARQMAPTMLATLEIWSRGSPVIIGEEVNTRRGKDYGG